MWRRTQKKLIKEAVHKPEMMPEMIQEAERKENLKARRKEYRESEKGKAAIKKWEKIGNFFSRDHKLEHVRWTLRRHFTGVRHRARMIKNL